MADSDVSPPGLASAQPPSRTIRLDLGKAGWMYLYFLTIVFAYIILTLTGHEIGVRWLFGGADTQQILGISPANDFLYILSILMVIALIGVILYFRSLRADATNRTDLSRSLTTFSISIIGVLVLWGIFLFIIGLDENVTADDAFQLAGLVISPLGTIIGFVAGQSAGASSQGALVEELRQANLQAIAMAGLVEPGRMPPDLKTPSPNPNPSPN